MNLDTTAQLVAEIKRDNERMRPLGPRPQCPHRDRSPWAPSRGSGGVPLAAPATSLGKR
jgi:hypothetical protein